MSSVAISWNINSHETKLVIYTYYNLYPIESAVCNDIIAFLPLTNKNCCLRYRILGKYQIQQNIQHLLSLTTSHSHKAHSNHGTIHYQPIKCVLDVVTRINFGISRINNRYCSVDCQKIGFSFCVYCLKVAGIFVSLLLLNWAVLCDTTGERLDVWIKLLWLRITYQVACWV